MELSLIREKPAIISFIFFGAFLSGLVLVGICSSFSLMLTEREVGVAKITKIMLATLPYSWKFAISPFVKNLILKHRDSKRNIIKILAYTSQFVLFSGFASLGIFEKEGNVAFAIIMILLVVIAISIHDILRDHMKLTLFDSKEFGYVTAIENAGFRLGMFTAGACMIYIANSTGWTASFIITASSVLFATIATFFIHDNLSHKSIQIEQSVKSLNQYLNLCVIFFKKYGVFTLLFVIIAFKITDSCINVLKPMFMHHLGVSRSAFANIAHLYGLIAMIMGGAFAGFLTYRIGLSFCVRITFFAQMIASLFYMYFAVYKVDILTLGILINVATFVFGFSGVVFRTMVSRESHRDVNMYTILLSIGSLVRIGSYSFAGFIVDHFSWGTIFFICLISNIPGFFLYSKLRREN